MKHKILSLVIAVTMLFGTAGVAFAADGTAGSLAEKVAALNAELQRIEAEIEALDTETDPTLENLKALQAELEAVTAQYNDAYDALVLSKKYPNKVTITHPTKYSVKVSWKASDEVKALAEQYRVTLYRNGKLWKTVFVKPTATSMTFSKGVARGVKYNAYVAPVALYDGEKYLGLSKNSADSMKAIGQAKFSVKKSGKKVAVKATDLNTNYYQIQISKDKNFKKGVKKITVYTNLDGLNKTLSLTKHFQKGNNYIKVRPATKYNGVWTYGKWTGKLVVKR